MNVAQSCCVTSRAAQVGAYGTSSGVVVGVMAIVWTSCSRGERDGGGGRESKYAAEKSEYAVVDDAGWFAMLALALEREESWRECGWVVFVRGVSGGV